MKRVHAEDSSPPLPPSPHPLLFSCSAGDGLVVRLQGKVIPPFPRDLQYVCREPSLRSFLVHVCFRTGQKKKSNFPSRQKMEKKKTRRGVVHIVPSRCSIWGLGGFCCVQAAMSPPGGGSWGAAVLATVTAFSPFRRQTCSWAHKETKI